MSFVPVTVGHVILRLLDTFHLCTSVIDSQSASYLVLRVSILSNTFLKFPSIIWRTYITGLYLTRNMLFNTLIFGFFLFGVLPPPLPPGFWTPGQPSLRGVEEGDKYFFQPCHIEASWMASCCLWLAALRIGAINIFQQNVKDLWYRNLTV